MGESTAGNEIRTTSFRLNVAELDRLRKLGEADDRSLNYMVAKAVREYLERHEPKGKGAK